MVLNNAGPRYYITRVLKEGGQGAVYEAIDDNDKIYAVKEMLDRFDSQQERAAGIARFKAEAELLERLSHPRIPRVYANFEDEQRHYLVMDFVVGEDLEEVVLREGAIPEPQVLAWADQISDVLGYLHSNGLIYRDMKPSNVMIDFQNGGIKLVDFGIAKVLQPTLRGTQIGTPGYAPPEQYQGLATTASDIFALGATLHHMLTGRDPTQQQPFTFPPIRDLQAQVSQRTADAIQRALQMKPEDRFATVGDFRAALGFRPGTAQRLVSRAPLPVANAAQGTSPAAAAPVPPTMQPPTAKRSAPAPAPPPVQPPTPARRVPASPPAARNVPPPQPVAAPKPRRSLLRRTCLWLVSLIGLGIVGIVLATSIIFGYPIPGLQSAPTVTPQTFVQQPFTAENLEIVIQLPPTAIDEALVNRGFFQAFEQAARAQYGAGVQIQSGTLVYLQPPLEVGQDAAGVRYQASIQGDILIPQP